MGQYDNILLDTQNFVMHDGYFFTFDHATDMLLQKTDDGVIAFSYPLDTVLTTSIISLEYDGVNYWTLEDLGSDDIRIRRWRIENYVCNVKQTIALYSDISHKYDVNTFTVEHYHTTVSGNYSAGASTIYMHDDYSGRLSSGMSVTLGPNSDGNSETINVFDTNPGYVVLEDPTAYDYEDGDALQFYKNIWFFNNYNGTSSSTGAIYKHNAYTGSYLTHYASGAYKDIRACTFFKISSITGYTNTDMLCYVKAGNLLFVNIYTIGPTLDNYGSMIMDNINANQNDIITVYDLSMDGDNIYRLQTQATYYGSTTTLTGYNYQLATLNPFVTSIALSASPGIIAANLVSQSTITAVVKDQFNQPVVARLVNFADDDTNGILNPTFSNTNSDGEASVNYKSGNQAREVIITATVAQV